MQDPTSQAADRLTEARHAAIRAAWAVRADADGDTDGRDGYHAAVAAMRAVRNAWAIWAWGA